MSKPNLVPVQHSPHTLSTAFAVIELSKGTPFSKESEKLFAVALRHYKRDEKTVRFPKGPYRLRDFELIGGLLSGADVDLPTRWELVSCNLLFDHSSESCTHYNASNHFLYTPIILLTAILTLSIKLL
ncbi:hypothetical protein QAD02_003641 [Eretmocerus hayati]|uniref:Uncharacterized protein n=1 Tax=Eretmocerus hayati TaxID=131215 RepID=A0ACC2NMS0_9HYME|nr:hypothetical protein QAD02_003641 [Eretmocerus hayati]